MALTCDVCFDFLLDNLNASGIIGRYDTVATLCTLHHAVAADVMARYGKRAIQHAGEAAAREAVVKALAPFKTASDGYLLRNKYRYMFARTG